MFLTTPDLDKLGTCNFLFIHKSKNYNWLWFIFLLSMNNFRLICNDDLENTKVQLIGTYNWYLFIYVYKDTWHEKTFHQTKGLVKSWRQTFMYLIHFWKTKTLRPCFPSKRNSHMYLNKQTYGHPTNNKGRTHNTNDLRSKCSFESADWAIGHWEYVGRWEPVCVCNLILSSVLTSLFSFLTYHFLHIQLSMNTGTYSKN